MFDRPGSYIIYLLGCYSVPVADTHIYSDCGNSMFKINDSILWAVLMLVISGLADKVAEPCWRMSWQGEAQRVGLPDKDGDKIIRSSENLVDAARSPIIGALLNMGRTAACLIIAGYLAISAIVLSVKGDGKNFLKNP